METFARTLQGNSTRLKVTEETHLPALLISSSLSSRRYVLPLCPDRRTLSLGWLIFDLSSYPFAVREGDREPRRRASHIESSFGKPRCSIFSLLSKLKELTWLPFSSGPPRLIQIPSSTSKNFSSTISRSERPLAEHKPRTSSPAWPNSKNASSRTRATSRVSRRRSRH
jgi:hypothetical protein